MRRLGIELTPEHPTPEIVETAQAAEDAGFDTAFVSSHHFNRDPFVVADRIGQSTGLDVGPGVVNPYETHPVSLATRMGTLDETTDGRAVFGRAQYDSGTGGGTVDPETEGRLRLVTGGRAGGWPVDRTAPDRPLQMHPADASDRSVAPTDEVVVSNGPVAVETTVELTDRIRQGTVSLPAEIADPLLRCEASTVSIRSTSEYRDRDT